MGTAILGFSTPIDQAQLNSNWDKFNAPYHKIVENEVERAKDNGITISPQTIETLRFIGKQRVVDLSKNVKSKFKNANPIPTDLVVVELILVKKTTLRSVDNAHRDDQEKMWPFALPRDVYRQVTLANDSVKTKYLKEILQEFSDIFKDQEKEPWELGETDGLNDKYYNRRFMQWWYKDIKLETDKYMDSLKIRE